MRMVAKEIPFQFEFYYGKRVGNILDGHRRMYLVGYKLGILAGNGLIPVNRSFIVDSDGRVVIALKDEFAGNDGVAFKVSDGIWATLQTGDTGRPYNEWAKVVRLNREQTILWSNDSPDGPIQEESAIHVAWLANVPYLLIDRTVRDFKAMTRHHEFLKSHFDNSTSRFVQDQHITNRQLNDLMAASDSEHPIQTIIQGGGVYEVAMESKLKDLPEDVR